MHPPAYGAFDTTGAFLRGGRWHSAGTRILYAAQHASLAVLETLVNSEGKKLPLRLITSILVPDSCSVEYSSWLEKSDSQRFGDAWIREKRSAVLGVPSVVVQKMELNFLLNPAHPDFSAITLQESSEFMFDPRFALDPQ
jgi:RES domain-containing protein